MNPMTRRLSPLLLAFASLGLAPAALAQHPPGGAPDPALQRTETPVNDQRGDARAPAPPNDAIGPATFAELDANGDGKISRDEAALDARLAANFAVHDLDGDGALSQAEYRAGQNPPPARGVPVDEK